MRDLAIHYETPHGVIRAVDGIDIDLFAGETLGIVGESGCGKSTAAMGILRLVSPPGRIVGGEVWLDDEDFMSLSKAELRSRRWSKLSLIPQGAMNSLNPTMTAGAQIKDVLTTHGGRLSNQEFERKMNELARMVGLPRRVAKLYPHELSGGMKQRVCIAMAVALSPAVVIADEATSALDVIIQRVIAQTIQSVRDELNVAMIMIGHDMGLMAQMTSRIAVMYGGQIVEVAETKSLFHTPRHPYTRMLIEAVPSLTDRKPPKISAALGHDPRMPPSGCVFRLRCPYADNKCASRRPKRIPHDDGTEIACHNADLLPPFAGGSR